MVVKYLKFSWKENEITRKSLIGIRFDQDTGFIKIRWLDKCALPVTEEVISLLKYMVENDWVGLTNPCRYRIIEKYGSSGCLDIIIIDFPYFQDEFEDFGYVAGKIHVSMFGRLNEEIIYEGNIWNFIILLERLQRLSFEFEDIKNIKNIEVKEFIPWGESLRRIKRKQIEKIDENYEYEKF